jgi:methionyl aminopeptidase
MITDSAISVIAGKPKNQRVRQLLAMTEQAMLAGIEAAQGGCRVGTIAGAVQQVLDQGKFGIVRDLVGHGVGHQLHEEPNIPNIGKADTGFRLEAGMTIAIEPMATLGGHRVYTDQDEWTVLTADGTWAAHFEHTILLTESGSEILTQL